MASGAQQRPAARKRPGLDCSQHMPKPTGASSPTCSRHTPKPAGASGSVPGVDQRRAVTADRRRRGACHPEPRRRDERGETLALPQQASPTVEAATHKPRRRDERGETLALLQHKPGRRDERGETLALLQHKPGRRDERGETLALLIVWPALITAILLMLVHAFIVTNARAEAEVAASQGLRSAWRAAADSDFLTDPGSDPAKPYADSDPHPDVLAMVEAAMDAVARAAATEGGWRWWTPGVAEVYSDWCDAPGDPTDPPGRRRPVGDETGWVRVVVSGEVFGPLAALWPDRWDRVYAAAQGPAIVVPREVTEPMVVPAELELC